MSDRLDSIKTNFKAEELELRRQRRELDQRQRMMLSHLNADELYELATECGEERGPEHCWKCEAWEMWVDLEERAGND